MPSFRLSPQKENTKGTLDTLAELNGPCERFRGGYAYVTETGVNELQQTIPSVFEGNITQEWLASIEDGITHPEALEILSSRPNTEVRIPNGEEQIANTSLDSESLFHPKFSWVTRESGHDLVLGSANLTQRALYSNWEMNVHLEGISGTEHSNTLADLDSWWESAWENATAVDSSFIQEYDTLRDEYIERNPPSFLQQSSENPLSLHDADVLWTEVDTVMGYNDHQIEVPLTCSPYFSRNSSVFTDGDQVYVTFTFRGKEYNERSVRGHPNQMCRINLPNEVGKQFNLTEYSVIFDHVNNNNFKIRLVPDDEADRVLNPIRTRSESQNQTIEMPSKGRTCGWV
jgi:HKD family nuclease